MPPPQPPNRRHLILLAVVLAVGSSLRVWHLGNLLASPLAHQEIHATSSDMYAFSHLGHLIASGDWLCETGYHPYMDWMNEIAPIEKFEQWWGGKEIYHQTPLYPYMLAVSYLLFGSNVPLLILQVLGSVLALFLLYDLGRQFLDARAGLIAAGIGAVFAPAIVLDAIQLRASFNTSITLLSIWLLMRLRDRCNPRLALLTGGCLAASYLLRPTGLLLMVLGPLCLLIDSGLRARWKRWIPHLAIAAVVVLLPFFARNALVGAPLFALSTRGPETVIQAQGAGADPGFMSSLPAAEYRKRMEAGHGSITRALATSIDTWPGGIEDWLWHQWQKVKCVFGDYEYNNNINFYWYRNYTPVLPLLPTFGWFVGFGLLGVLLLVRNGRRTDGKWIGLIAAGALWMGCMLGFALGRYRMPLAMLLTIPAGVTVSLLWTWIRAHRFVPATVVAAASLALCALSYYVLPARSQFKADGTVEVLPAPTRALYLQTNKRRFQECVAAAKRLHAEHRTAAAIELVRNYGTDYLDFFQHLEKDLMAAAMPQEKRLEVTPPGPERDRLMRENQALQTSYLHLLHTTKTTLQVLAQTLHLLHDTQGRDRFHGLARQFEQRLQGK